ncbi:MAG: response regulator [Geobacter sp.]|nr:response regulator [Geobacter sp.]
MDDRSAQRAILVMDDDEDVRFIAGLMLQRLGFSVDLAETGDEAIELFRRAHEAGRGYHAVILDLNIPGGMGGQEVIVLLRAIDPAVTAYVSCGNPYDPIMENPADFGFQGAIAKPFLPEHLQVLLHQP